MKADAEKWLTPKPIGANGDRARYARRRAAGGHDLLARHERRRAELSLKSCASVARLPRLIDPTLDRLAEEGLLDESRYLESFIASRARGGHGPLRIREELAQRGLPRADIERALGACEVDWSAQCVRSGDASSPAAAGRQEKAQQGRFLAYRGYSMESISRLLNGAATIERDAGPAASVPVFRQVDVVQQFPQTPLVAPVEHEGEAGQVAELRFVLFLLAVGLLLEAAAQAEAGEVFVQVASAASFRAWFRRITNVPFSQRLEWKLR